MTEQQAKYLVLGVGNDRQRDAGVGRHVARAMVGHVSSEIVVEDLSGGAAEILEMLKNYQHVLMIDACELGMAPGEFILLPAEDVEFKLLIPHSFRQFSIADLLELGEITRIEANLTLLLVQPEEIAPSLSLSDTLQAAIPALMNMVFEYVETTKSKLE